jgi:hypothetical protein
MITALLFGDADLATKCRQVYGCRRYLWL